MRLISVSVRAGSYWVTFHGADTAIDRFLDEWPMRLATAIVEATEGLAISRNDGYNRMRRREKL